LLILLSRNFVQIVIVQIDHVRSFWNPDLETRFFDIWSPIPFKSELISSCCKEAHGAILYHEFFYCCDSSCCKYTCGGAIESSCM
jgi:hypothetical protein